MENIKEEKIITMLEQDDFNLSQYLREVAIFVNGFGVPTRDVVNTIFELPEKAQIRFYEIVMAFVYHLSIESGGCDGRNEIAVRVANEIMGIYDSTKSCDASGDVDYSSSVKSWILNLHRTLQQSFAGICFCYIDKLVDNPTSYSADSPISKEQVQLYRDDLGEKWWRMPMI